MSTKTNERTLRIAACLGVDSASAGRSHAARVAALTPEAARLDTSLGAGSVALVTGPSGAGKSTLLDLLPRAGRVDVKPLTGRQSRVRVASLCARMPVAQWAGLLARFGLAEAGVLVSRAGELSAGERARLELALAAARCERDLPRGTRTSPVRKHGDGTGCTPALADSTGGDREVPVDRPCASAQGSLPAIVTLVVDEWCSVLDRATAASVASGAARWARERGVRLIGATAHEDLAAAIGADVVVRLNGQGGGEWTECGLNAAGAG